MSAFSDELIAQARIGNLSALQTIKQGSEGQSAQDAFAGLCETVDSYRDASLRQTRAHSLADYVKSKAAFYHETGPSGVPFTNAAPRVIGEGNQRDLHCRTRASFVARIANARLWGYSAVIEAEGLPLFDIEDWESEQTDDDLSFDPRVFRSAGREISYIYSGRREPDMKLARAFSLMGPHSDAFGHWIWEYLPKLAAAIATGLMPPMAVLVEDFLPPTHREALLSILPQGWRVQDVPFNNCVEVAELWCAPALIFMPLSEIPGPKSGWDYMASPVDRYLPAIEVMRAPFEAKREAAGPRRKIFLSRHTINRRKMVNREEIEDLCRAHGYDIVIPESLNFAAQVELIRSASHIVAPEGSATLLCYYANPGTKLVMLSHPDTIGQATLTAILDKLSVETTILTGPVAKRHRHWRHFDHYRIEILELSLII